MTRDRGLRLALPVAALMFSGALFAADLRKATVQPTYTLDLESGATAGRDGREDLWWQAKTRSERCLGPAMQSRAMLAPLAPQDFNSAGAAKLSGLAYSARCIPHTNSGSALQKGLAFAVRTTEGNFAKVRVAGINSRNDLALEWRVFPAPATQAGTGSSNPSLTIPQLFDQARQMLRAQRGNEAVPPLQEAVTLAGKLPAGALRADALSQAGQLLWSARRIDLAESALLAAAQQMENLPASAVPNETRGRTYRMLGVVYRDQQKNAEAIPWLERAVKTDEALPESGPQAASTRDLNLSSNLGELAMALCRVGNEDAAVAADRRRLETCDRMRNPGSVGACRQGRRLCINGQLRETVPVQTERKKQQW